MSFTIKASRLASYYPFQMRVNIILQSLGYQDRSILYFSGSQGFVNNVVIDPAIKDLLDKMSNFTEVDAFEAITDNILVSAVEKSYAKIGSLITVNTATE